MLLAYLLQSTNITTEFSSGCLARLTFHRVTVACSANLNMTLWYYIVMVASLTISLVCLIWLGCYKTWDLWPTLAGRERVWSNAYTTLVQNIQHLTVPTRMQMWAITLTDNHTHTHPYTHAQTMFSCAHASRRPFDCAQYGYRSSL